MSGNTFIFSANLPSHTVLQYFYFSGDLFLHSKNLCDNFNFSDTLFFPIPLSLPFFLHSKNLCAPFSFLRPFDCF